MPPPRPSLKPSLDWLLVLVPIAILLEVAGGPDLAIFLTSAAAQDSPRTARRMAEFRTGWHVGSLLTVGQVRTMAAAHGLELVRDLDLTPYLELRRPRDRWIGALLAVGRVFRPTGLYWQSLVGGDALQWALIHDLLSYRFLELRRRG